MNACEYPTNLFAEHTRQRHSGTLDRGDLHPELAKRGGDLAADEAEPHDDGTASAVRDGANSVAILDGAQLEDALQVRTGHRQGSVSSASGHHEPVVDNPFAALQLDDLPLGVDRRRPHPQRELDALLGVVPDGFD